MWNWANSMYDQDTHACAIHAFEKGKTRNKYASERPVCELFLTSVRIWYTSIRAYHFQNPWSILCLHIRNIPCVSRKGYLHN